MIDLIFRYCVLALMSLAYWLGTTYEAVNVWIFVIIWPIFTLALIGIVIWQYRRIQALTKQQTLPIQIRETHGNTTASNAN